MPAGCGRIIVRYDQGRHAHLGHGAPTYHLADRHHHIHLVCRDCTNVIEADVSVAAEFTAKLRESFGFETEMKHFAIFGRCKDCQDLQE